MAIVEAKKQRAIFSAFARIRFDDGQRVLVSLAPTGVSILRVMFGFLPIYQVWSCSEATLDRAFGPMALPDEECIDTILRCITPHSTIRDMKIALREMEISD